MTRANATLLSAPIKSRPRSFVAADGELSSNLPALAKLTEVVKEAAANVAAHAQRGEDTLSKCAYGCKWMRYAGAKSPTMARLQLWPNAGASRANQLSERVGGSVGRGVFL